MKRNHTLIAGVVAGVVLAVAGATYAQQSGTGQGCPEGMGLGMGSGHGHHGRMDPSAMIESHLAELKTQLNITPAQEAAWQTFATQSKQMAVNMKAMHNQTPQGTGTAPERMAQHAAALQQQATQLALASNAFSSLYGTLTPAQRAIADAHVGMMGHQGGRHGQRAS